MLLETCYCRRWRSWAPPVARNRHQWVSRGQGPPPGDGGAGHLVCLHPMESRAQEWADLGSNRSCQERVFTPSSGHGDAAAGRVRGLLAATCPEGGAQRPPQGPLRTWDVCAPAASGGRELKAGPRRWPEQHGLQTACFGGWRVGQEPDIWTSGGNVNK